MARETNAPVPFWLVWNPAGRPPQVQHTSGSAALSEAKRLAHMQPGDTFYVLVPTKAVVEDRIEITHFAEPPDDGILC